MADLKFQRGNTAQLAAEPIQDGTISFDTEKKALYIDTDTERAELQSSGSYVKGVTYPVTVDGNGIMSIAKATTSLDGLMSSTDKVELGNKQTTLVKYNIIKTLCEDVVLNDATPSYTLPERPNFVVGDTYLLTYKYYDKDGNYSPANSGTVLAPAMADYLIQFIDNWEPVYIQFATLNDKWRESGATSHITIHQVEVIYPNEDLYTLASHEGYGNTPSGLYAHVEGVNNKAAGYTSHAEGYGGDNLYNFSHTEGYKTSVHGKAAHAEGYQTDAYIYAHSEGYMTRAGREASHAEGYQTRANHSYSHAEGDTSCVGGIAGHVEGNGCVSTNLAAHAEGYATIAGTDWIFHVKSVDTTTSTITLDESKFPPSFSFSRLNSFSEFVAYTPNVVPEFTLVRVKSTDEANKAIVVYEDITNAKLNNTTTLICYNGSTNSNKGAHAEGILGLACADAAHAEGYKTTAAGLHSHAEGSESQALMPASHSEGNITYAMDSYTHAEGNLTAATKTEAHVEGYACISANRSTHAEGYVTAAGTNLIFGIKSVDTATRTITLDENKLPSGYTFAKLALPMLFIAYTTADVTNPCMRISAASVDTTAGTIVVNEDISSAQLDANSTLLCYSSVISAGKGAHSEGMLSTAEADAAHAEGRNTTASGSYSHSEGSSTKATGIASHSEGESTSATGNRAHAEGSSTTASGQNSHAEGYDTVASGSASHVEGGGFTNADGSRALGYASHAEGASTYASGGEAHAEGGNTQATGNCSHAEGSNCYAWDKYAHAEGLRAYAINEETHAEGGACVAVGFGSHAEGLENIAGPGYMYSIESYDATAKTFTIGAVPSYGLDFNNMSKLSVGQKLYVFNNAYINSVSQFIISAIDTTNRVVTTSTTIPTSNFTPGLAYILTTHNLNAPSHVEGYQSGALNRYCHAEGFNTRAFGESSHSEGVDTKALATASHASGCGTTSDNFASFVTGKYNKPLATGASETAKAGDAFVIGNGTASARSNAYRVTYSGEVFASYNFNSAGADYAEYFEWLDGNSNNEDRVGYFVTLDEDKIRIANTGDYVLGIVSGHPCVIGNSDEDWLGKYEHDEFGRIIKEEIIAPVMATRMIEVEPLAPNNNDEEMPNHDVQILPQNREEENGNAIDYAPNMIAEEYETGEFTHTWQNKLNPNYNSTQEYVERKDRPEWSAIGMVGVLAVRDDGTCKVNGYCKVADGGIATSTTGEMTIEDGKIVKGYRVIKRVSDNVIKVVLK